MLSCGGSSSLTLIFRRAGRQRCLNVWWSLVDNQLWPSLIIIVFPQGSLTVPKCLNVASSDGVRLSATVKSLEKSLTQVLLINFTKLWSHVHVLPGLVDHLRGVEGGVGDVGDGGEPVLRQVLPALGVGHPCQGEEYSQYEKIDHYDYIVIITIAMVSHHCYDTKAVFFVHHFY